VNHSSADLVQRAAALRGAQQMEEALEVITRAVKAKPNDPRTLFGLAQIRFETWRTAAENFAEAQRYAPGNPDLIRNHALALAAEGEDDVAIELLENVLDTNPGWTDGHKTLATLRITSGQQDRFDQSYIGAVAADPDNLALRMAWFQHHAIAQDWIKARSIIQEAQSVIGPSKSFDLATLFIASETGEGEADFTPYAQLGDPGTDLCYVRHLLRSGQWDAAEAVASRHIDLPSARIFWPYLSLCWRLLGDDRADWLDSAPLYVRTFDLDFSKAQLSQLAEVLRGLHRLKSPYPEQSVRGGTQTDRQIFFHPDPVIQDAKAKISAATQEYINALPSVDEAHPLLSHDRDGPLLFEGSWSVRLKGAGYHSSHTHVKGWISSAFYVAVPLQSEMGPDQAGWLAAGSPPKELGLTLPDQAIIEPRPARLVLFPSTSWHSTRPIQAGDRLTIAFDVKPPL
jgi:Tfp pilus assembly protein PilF